MLQRMITCVVAIIMCMHGGLYAIEENPSVAKFPEVYRMNRFKAHLDSLTSVAHRVSGSKESEKAGDYIKKQLGTLQDGTIYELDIPVFDLKTKQCYIEIDGEKIELLPMRPNVIVPPATGEAGLQGRYYYIPDAQALDSMDVSLNDAVVATEYDCEVDFWHRLFKLGAEAVLFLGDTTGKLEYPRAIKHAGAPVNLIRLYAPAAENDSVDLRRNHASVHVKSTLRWNPSAGRNILMHLSGSDPDFSPRYDGDEMVVVSANYDTYGEVPDASGGALEAANVAAVIEAARYFHSNRPKRDMLFIISDYAHQNFMGMRAVYDALTMRPKQIAQIAQDHDDEQKFLTDMRSLINKETIDRQLLQDNTNFLDLLYEVTELAWNNYSEDLMALRMETPESEATGETADTLEQIKNIKNRWGEILRHLTKHQIEKIDENDFKKVLSRVRTRIEKRMDELAFLQIVDEQREKISAQLGPKRIDLHVSYNFSDDASVWGPVVGDDLYSLVTTGGQREGSWDNPGWYGPVMKVMRETKASIDSNTIRGFSDKGLIDAGMTLDFIPGEFVSENCVAGVYGYYNCAFMTYHDTRMRSGHPIDDISNLKWERIYRQASQASVFLRQLSNAEGLSLARSFKNVSVTQDTKFPLWNNGTYRGYSMGISVAGSLTKDRPATGALCALWPTTGGWPYLGPDIAIPGFKRYLLSRVNTHGKFGISGVNGEIYQVEKKEKIYPLGMMFDSSGLVKATVDLNSQTQSITSVDLFSCNSHIVAMPLYGMASKAQTMVMKASGNVEPDMDRNFHGIANDFIFFYTHGFFSADRFKVFQKYGAVALNVDREDKIGTGFEKSFFNTCVNIDSITSNDLWMLNENRLQVFRENGVTNADIEVLHHEAELNKEDAQDTTGIIASQRLHARSAMLSRLIYEPIRDIMNDMVTAIVVLLILTVPFAFALERLIICSSSIYWRVGGFVLMFVLTFVLVFLFHPGFAIASSPLVVFLAFAILVMSAIVISIMFSKFKYELMALQQKSTRAHTGEISRMGTAMAAIGMGMSTMRRRPVRTLLTCITVVVLTFTILCFASFSRGLGVKSSYEGPAGGTVSASGYIRNLDFSKINTDVVDMVRGLEGKEGLVAPQWWKVKTVEDPQAFDVALPADKENVFVSAILGITPEELDYWEELKGALRTGVSLDTRTALKNNGVYLPTLMRRRLGLEYGDTVYVDGRKCLFAGEVAVDKMQRLNGLDGRSILPVDFRSQTYDTTKSKGLVGGSNAGEMVQRDFVRLSANEIAITSAENVKKMRGSLHTVSVYGDDQLQFTQNAEYMAKLTALPVWSRGEEGVERLIFAEMAGVTGGMGLVIPILVGGFIIFGTLLGSITDREKEVYTFSALGLSPSHVGFLFLAESGIYAVIGGVGGQILAQIVAYIASFLADQGIIHEVSINFSSSNSMFAIVVVMATVLISAIYPAYKASKSANPGVARSWKMPTPDGDYFKMEFPFTVSEYDFTGMVSYLAEHFREHSESGMGKFTSENVQITRQKDTNHLALSSDMYLAPFDLGISHRFRMTAVASEIPGVNEVFIEAWRMSGSHSDWRRSNKVFLRELRKQFILWRTLSSEVIENYRMNTLQVLGKEKEMESES